MIFFLHYTYSDYCIFLFCYYLNAVSLSSWTVEDEPDTATSVLMINLFFNLSPPSHNKDPIKSSSRSSLIRSVAPITPYFLGAQIQEVFHSILVKICYFLCHYNQVSSKKYVISCGYEGSIFV